jgi:threonine synthase
VKRAFAEESVAEKVQLLGINSINIVRILVQSVYYFYSYFRVAVDIERPVDYVVPTGNFGDILAGYYAKRMGLPIGKLVIATNENDILTRFMESGEYKVADAVKPTVTPSMDIQVSSNFERYLFELAGRDDCKVKNWMQDLCKFGGFKVSAWELTMATSDFVAYRASEEECLDTIRLVAKSTKGDLVIDPHTAVGLHVAIKYKKSSDERNPIICLATAHPAKFPATVSKALAGSGVDAGNWISHPSLVELESRPRKVQKLESFALGSLFKYF